MYRELCDKELPWDTDIPQMLKKKFKRRVNDITNVLIEIPRSIPTYKESITSVDLHSLEMLVLKPTMQQFML